MTAAQWVRRLRRLVYRLARTGSGYCFRPSRTTLSLQTLEDRLAPAAAPTYRDGLSVAAADLSGDGVPDLVGSAGPRVVAYDGTTGAPLTPFAFPDPAFTGEVFVAAGDVTGDGLAELVVAAGAGGGPRVTVTDPRTGQVLANFFAYAPDFRGGVRVAVADVDGNGTAEIVTVPGEGGGPQVRVFDGAGRSLGRDAFAFAPDFRGGASVAAGDVTGDGAADVVVGAGPGGGPRVVVLDGRTGTQVESYFAYAADFSGGVWVAAADVDGNGTADVVTGAGPGGTPHVRVFAGHGTAFAGWLAYAPGFTGGVRVTAADLTGDGFADVVTGPGPGGGPHVTMWDGYTFAAAQSTYAVTDGGPAAFAFAAPTPRQPLFDGRTLLVPPAGVTALAADLLRRFTDRPGEVGLYRVDDAAGSVGGVAPGDPGYAAAALAAGRTVPLFAPADGAGASRPLALAPGGRYAAYLIRGGPVADWLAANPGNDVGAGPLAVFPFPAANPGGRDLFRLGPRNRAAFEDTPGGDADANDAVVGFRTAAEPSDLPPGAITPLPAAGEQQPPTPPPPTPNFPADLAGWAVAERGGTGGGRGTVVVQGGTAVMREGDSFTVTLSRSFVVPAGGGVLDFAYPTFGFASPSPGAFVNDAFEAALLDATGRPLVPTVGAGRDAFFNVTETQGEARGTVVSADGTRVRLDLSGVPAGTAATLVLRLVNNDADATGTAAVAWVAFPSAVAADPPVKFFVADAGSETVGRFGAEGLPAGGFGLSAAVSPAGAASNAAGDRVWVVDAGTGRVHVYAPAGGLVGEWAADATDPQGVSVAGGDLWLVDRGTRTVRRYVGGMGRTAGPAAADAAFALDPANARPSDLVTDGATVWVTDDAAAAVFVYDAAGALLGRWGLDPDNAAPSGITRNPAGGADLWVLDRARKQVFQYAGGADARTGQLGAAGTFLLGAGAGVPEGIADPPPGPVLTAQTSAAAGDVPAGSTLLISGTALPAAGDVRPAGENVTRFDGFGDTSGLSLNGTAAAAATADGTVLRLAGAGPWQAGSAFSRVPVRADRFSTAFSFRISDAGGGFDGHDVGADGLVFVIQPVSATLGSAGEGIGFQGIPAGLGVEFDTWQNDNLHDPDSNHVGLVTGGNSDHGPGAADTAPVATRFDDGRRWYAWVDYDGTTLSVRANQTGVRPAAALLARPVDLSDVLGGDTGFIGFTSGTGISWGNHDILAWEYRDTFDPVVTAAQTGIVAVTVDGRPADALDAAGGFFARADVLEGENAYRVVATDGLGRQTEAALHVRGTSVSARVDTARFQDVSGGLTAAYARTSFREADRTLYADVAVRNTGAYPVGGPLLVGVRNVSDPAVRVLNAAGTLPDGTPYLDAGGLLAGRLAPGAVTAPLTLAFSNPGRGRFTYDLVFYGRLNQSPALTTAPAVEATPGRPYVYAAAATDPDGDPLSFTLMSGPAGMAVDPATGFVTWTPAAADVGSVVVQLAVADGFGGRAEQRYTLTVAVAPPNRPPVFLTDPAVCAAVGTVYAYAVAATDPDGDPLTYTLASGPAGMAVDAATGLVSWIPVAAQTGSQAVVLTAADGRGGTVTQAFNVCVGGAPGNHAPEIVSTPPLRAVPGAAYRYRVVAVDPDPDDTRSYRLESGPAGAVVNPAGGMLTWTPAAGQAGPQLVVVAAEDGRGGVAEQAFTVEVSAAAGAVGGVVWDDQDGDGQRGTAGRVTYDAVIQFSTDTNPTGPWTYGYRDLLAPPAALTVFDTLSDYPPGVIRWVGLVASDGNPSVGHAITGAVVNDGTPVYRPEELSLHPGPGGEYAVVRFTAPRAGVYSVAARFGAADVVFGGTDAHVLVDGVAVFDALISLDDGAAYDAPTVVLRAGETVDFTLGYGGNGFLFDTTGLAAVVTGPGGQEPGLPGRVVYLDANDDGRLDPGEPTAVTDQDGRYTLADVPAGPVRIALEPVPGAEQTYPPGGGGYDLVLGPGEARDGLDFGVRRRVGGANLIVNGGFEQGPPPGRYLVLPTGSTAVPGWIVTHATVDYEGTSWVELDGERSIDLSGTPGAGGIAQTIPTVPGRTYTVEFDLAGNTYGGPAVKDMEVRAAGQSARFSFDTTGQTPTDMGWRRVRWQFVATFATTAVEFDSLVPEESTYGPVIDLVAVYAPADDVNDPPQIAGAPPAAVTAGNLYRFDPAATDSDADPITFDLPLAPAGMTVHPTVGVLVWRPTPDQRGPHDVVLRVRDGRGGVAVRTFRVTVIPPNAAPAITSAPPPGPLGVGLPYVYRVRAVHADSDPLEFRLEGAVTGMAVNAATGLFTWTPAPDQIGTRVMTVVVDDGRGGAARQELRLVVEAAPANHPPVVSSVPPGSAAPGQPYRYPVAAADSDGDPLVYTLVAGPPGMVIDPATGLVSWTPDAGQSGPESVELRVTDGRGGEAVQRFVVAVTPRPADRPPTIAAVPPVAVVLGRTVRVRLAATDPDGDSVRWVLVAGPRGVAVEPDTGVLVWTPAADQLGPHDLVVRAEDPFGLSATRTFTATVVCTDRPPVIRSFPPTAAAVGAAYLYAVVATDPDGDALAYTLVAGPEGLAVDPVTGFVTWTPAPGQAGPRVVSVRAADGAGEAATQTFTVVVAATPVNRPPVVTSAPPARAAVGVPLVYAVAAYDPDGDAVTYRLIDSPPGVAADPATGLLTWTPTEAGTVVISVSATDPAGAQGVQTFVVRVTANHAPVITSTPPATAVAGAAYRYDLRATDPEGDPLTYRVDAGPAGLAVDTFGRVTWTPPAALSGLHTVTLAVVDDAGAAVAQSFTVTVGADTTAPRVELLLSTTAVTVGGVVRVQVRATDDVGVSGLTLTAGGVPLGLDSTGAAVFTAAAAGSVEVTATAADAAGNVGRATRRLLVADPAAAGPEVSLLRFDVRLADGSVRSLDPAEGPAELTYLTDVVGTAADPAGLFDHYQLLVAPASAVDPANLAPEGPAWRVIGGGRTEVVNGVLGTFDPTTLQNDSYYLAVAAYDAFGHGRFKAALVAVSGAAKPGQFRLEFTDLTVPLAGIPVAVTRVYDTLDAGTEGEFGFGWSLAIADPRIRESVAPTGDGFFATGGAFRDGTKVYLTGPDGRRVGFTFRPTRYLVEFGGQLYDPLFGAAFTPAFVPDPGVTSRLEVDALPVQLRADGTYAALGFRFPYNPDQYRLTTFDGLTYAYDQFAGLQTVTDRNGTTLTYRTDGVFSSTGAAVRFVRDGQGRITQVTDPDGNAVRYAYTAAGDLGTVTDRTGLVTTHSYRADRPHYLDEVHDPLGNRAVKAEYDAAGRLLATTDALGHRSVRGYDPAAFTETVADAIGNVTTLVYDERGNVVRETDPLGHVTLRAYDAADNETATTDPLGRFTTRTFDARRNRLSETDPLGHTTRYEYDRFNNVTRVTDPLGRVTVYLFDERGNPAGSVDALGNATRRTNDAHGRPLTETDARGYTTAYEYAAPVAGPTRVTHPDGMSRTIAYDALGLPVLITDERGERLALAYDAAGRLLAVTAPDGGVTSYGYTGDRLTRQTDPLGRVTLYGYDAAGRLVTKTDARGGVTRYGYDAAGRLVSTTDPRGSTTTTAYDAAGRVDRVTDALGGVTRYGYDAAGNRTSETDANGNRRNYAFDELNRLVRKDDCPCPDETYTYDAAGNLLTVTDKRGNVTRYTYDALGRLLTETDALGGVTRYGYDATGNVTSVTDANGYTTTSAYDGRDRLVRQTDPAGFSVTFSYDGAGNQTATTAQLGHTTRFAYDGLGRLLMTTDADGGVTANAYDLAGDLVATTDPLGHTTRYGYDELRRLVTTTDAAGGVVRSEYDAAGNRTALTDPVGNRTTFGYDALNRQVRETDPLGRSILTGYDAVGNRTAVTDRNGRLRTFVYDELDRLTDETWWDGTAVVRTVRSTFDSVGNLTGVTDPDSSYTFSYDALNRQITADNAGTPNAPRVVLTSRYDAVGNRVEVTDNAGVTVGSTYDARDLLATRTWQGGGVSAARLDFAYDARGLRTGVARAADFAGTAVVSRSVLSYDALGRETGYAHTGAGGAAVSAYGYVYDAASRLVRELRNGVAIDYSYDLIDQLAGADRATGPDEAYDFDAAGNREGGGYQTGPGNRLISDGTFTYGYDFEGNLVRKTETATGAVTEYAYDHRNRLVAVTARAAGGSVVSEVRYTYDALDRRIATTTNGVRTATVHDGDATWADYDTAGTATARYLTGDVIDEMLARFRPGEGTAWYLTDKLGTVRELLGPTSAVLDRIDYDSFGRILAQTNPAASDRFTFTGRELDTTTDLFYYRARFYDSRAGRFTQTDPIGIEYADINAYRYVKNSPTLATDPTGKLEFIEYFATTIVAGGLFGAFASLICQYADVAMKHPGRRPNASDISVLEAVGAGISFALLGAAIALDPVKSPFTVFVLNYSGLTGSAKDVIQLCYR